MGAAVANSDRPTGSATTSYPEIAEHGFDPCLFDESLDLCAPMPTYRVASPARVVPRSAGSEGGPAEGAHPRRPKAVDLTPAASKFTSFANRPTATQLGYQSMRAEILGRDGARPLDNAIIARDPTLIDRIESRRSYRSRGGSVGITTALADDALCHYVAQMILTGGVRSPGAIGRSCGRTAVQIARLCNTPQFMEVYARLLDQHTSALALTMADERANPFKRMHAAEVRAMTTAVEVMEELRAQLKEGRSLVATVKDDTTGEYARAAPAKPSPHLMRTAAKVAFDFLDRGPNSTRYKQVDEAGAATYAPTQEQLRVMREADAEAFDGPDMADAVLGEAPQSGQELSATLDARAGMAPPIHRVNRIESGSSGEGRRVA